MRTPSPMPYRDDGADEAYERHARENKISGPKVYLALSMDGNSFKIGITTHEDTQDRHPRLMILWERPGNTEYENMLHRLFAEWRKPGTKEWYYAVPIIAMQFGLTFDRRAGLWRAQRDERRAS